MEYTVTWTIQLDAESPLEAAREAKKWQLDPESIANVFLVRESKYGRSANERVDLDEEGSNG